MGFEVGTEEYIRDTLTKAVGETEAKRITSRIFLNEDASGLDALKMMPPRAIADLIQGEHPQIQATVVSYLEAEKAAEVLAHLDTQTRLDVVMRIVSLQTAAPGRHERAERSAGQAVGQQQPHQCRQHSGRFESGGRYCQQPGFGPGRGADGKSSTKRMRRWPPISSN